MADNVIGSASIEVRAKLTKLLSDLAEAESAAKARVTAIEQRYGQVRLKGDNSGLIQSLTEAERVSQASMQRMAASYTQAARQGSDAFAQGSRSMSQSLKGVERQAVESSSGIKDAFREIAPALAAAFSVEKVAEYADQWTRLTNSLKVAGLQGQALGQTQSTLVGIANQNGVSIENLSGLYRQVGIASTQLGTSTADNLKISSAFAAAMRIQGTDTNTAKYATMEFGHALEETRVQARVFNALQFEMPVLLQAIAKNFGEGGLSVGQFRQRLLEGKVSNKEFADAVIASSAALEAQSKTIDLTIGASLVTLKNHLVEYIGTTGQSSGATAAMSGAIRSLGDNLGTLIPALEVIVAAMGIRWVAGMAAAETSLVALTIAHAKHIAGVVTGTRALNEVAVADAEVALAAKTSADVEVAAAEANVAAIQGVLVAQREEAAMYEANIALAAEARAAALASAPQARANASAGFANVIVGAGAQSAAPKLEAAAAIEASNSLALSRQNLARVNGEIAATETILAEATGVAAVAEGEAAAVTAVYTEAVAASGVAATLSAGAITLFNTAIAFVGGPIGAAVLALAGGLILLANASGESAKAIQDAEKKASDFQTRVEEVTGKGAEFARIIDRLTASQNDTASAAHNAASAFRDQAAAADIASRAVAGLNAEERQKRLREISKQNAELRAAGNPLGIDTQTGLMMIGVQSKPAAKAHAERALLNQLGVHGEDAIDGDNARVIADAQKNRARLPKKQQDALIAYEAAAEAETTRQRTLASNIAEQAGIRAAPAYDPNYKATPRKAKTAPGRDYEGDLVKAEEAARIASAGPNKQAAIEAERERNYLTERKKLTEHAENADGIAKADKQARDYADKLASAQLATLNEREGKKAAHAETAAERKAKAEANRVSHADSAETSQVRGFEGQEAKSREESAKAAEDKARSDLAAAASDTSLSDAERASRVKEAAARLRTAVAANDHVAIELDRVKQAQTAKDREIGDSTQLNAAQKAVVRAANDRAAAAQTLAIVAKDEADQAKNRAAIEADTERSRIAALQARVADEALTADQRAAAERELLGIERASAAARRIELARKGVSPDQIDRNRKADLDAVTAKATTGADNETKRLTSERLQAMQGLAKSSSERGELERQILKIEQDQRDVAVKLLANQLMLAAKDGSPAARASAAVQIAKLNAANDAYKNAQNEVVGDRTAGPLQSYLDGLNKTPGEINDQLGQVKADGLKSFNDGLVEAIMGTKTLGEAFHNIAGQIIADLVRIGVEQAVTRPLARMLFGGGEAGAGGGGGGIFSMISSVLGIASGNPAAAAGAASGGLNWAGTVFGGAHADGGMISGPGGPRSDSILARLSKGEFVVNAGAAADHLPLLEALNGGRLPRFAEGGLVAPSAIMPVSRWADSAGGRSSDAGRGAGVVEHRVTINLEGANGDETIRQIASQAAAASYASSIATTQARDQARARASRQSLAGY